MKKNLLLSVVLFAAWMPGQDAGEAALARARVIAEQEGDLRAAQQAYREVIEGKGGEGVKAEAALRLGSMLWRLEKKDEAKVWLEKAVAAGGEVGAAATAVLQGKAQGDEQEKAARAEALVDKMGALLKEKWEGAGGQAGNQGAVTTGWLAVWTAATRDLRWLGEPGVRALVAKLRELSGNLVSSRSASGVEHMPNALRASDFVHELWALGTPAADAYLREVATKGELPWRQLVAEACTDAAPDLLPVAQQFLRDSDPDGLVQRGAMKLAARFAAEDLKAMLADASPQVRTAGYSGIRELWLRSSPEEREQLLEGIVGRVKPALQEPYSQSSSGAWELAKAFVLVGPRSARRLVLEVLANWPSAVALEFPQMAIANNNLYQPIPLDDQELQLLAVAARALGPCPAVDAKSLGSVRAFVAVLFGHHQPQWSKAGIPSLLDLLELDYGQNPWGGEQWTANALQMASPSQLAGLVSVAPRLARPDSVLMEMSQRDLPVEVFAAACKVIEDVVVNPPPRPFEVFQWDQRSSTKVQTVGRNLQQLLEIIGRTKSPDAPDWLMHLLERFPFCASRVAASVVRLSISGVGEPARAAMRKLMVLETKEGAEWYGSSRSLLFAELARCGDVAAIPLYPIAYARVLGRASHPIPDARGNATGLHLAANNTPSAGVLAFLGLQVTASNQVGPPWHGYDAEHIVIAWRTLLQSDQRDKVFDDLGTLTRVQLEVLPLIAEVLPDLVAQSTTPQLNQRRDSVARLFNFVTAEDVVERRPLRDALAAGLQNASIAPTLVHYLKPDVVKLFATEVLGVLASLALDPPQGLLMDLARAGITVPTPILVRSLSSKQYYMRAEVLNALSNQPDSAVIRAVEQVLVNDDNSDIRVRACGVLERLLATDSIAPLLQALRDPAEPVRKAAAEALQSIRFYQDQQSHWQQVQSGVEVTKETAAAKLVLQAKTGAKDQRLLAIRSLAVLAAPETLPYLIEWTQDKDAEIAQAARDATAAIHQKAGAPK